MKQTYKISSFLIDDYKFIAKHIVNKSITQIIEFTETHISIMLDDGTIISFSNLEDELILDIKCLY
ncbi:hypothetical protein SYNTR_0253 [Candidatus Syntrophocurvum alkaliphilum]|uniref:Uncharacterized protein n=1 Tax=Candidatus Syntrophocurvum alkaliphilum TaxID=2293317 RepID=A0A6I6D6D1_9FIRM|nr:hypothetical protein [Candidatus Syntrophocurvum alkaliphilum]QGT98846.1 hypothetical protein SYNTR_0253 [Candidatus Syntrophocurvum alkaliphilum]